MSASVGSGVPSDGGGVAMVTESATVKSEGQENWKDTSMVGGKLIQYSKTTEGWWVMYAEQHKM